MQFGTAQEKSNFGRDKKKTTTFTADVQEKSNVFNAKFHLKDGDHKIWNCPLILNTTADERGEPLGNTSSGSAVGMQDIKRGNAPLKELMAKTVARRNNRLLHKDENPQSKGHTGEASTNPVFTANTCSRLLQLIAVRFSNGANNVDTLAVYATRSTISFIDAEIKTRLGTEGTKLTLSVAGINWRKYMASEKLSVKVIANDHDDDISFHVYPRMYLGNRRYDYSQIKQNIMI